MKQQGLGRILMVFSALILVMGVFITKPESPVRAAVVTVNSIADTDDGACNEANCTLREAVKYSPVGTQITFAQEIAAGVITLGSTLIIDKNLVIDNLSNNDRLTLNGNNAVQIMRVNPAVELTLRNPIFYNGNAGEGQDGGAIYNDDGSVIIENGYFTLNKGYQGGAIRNYKGTITINRSTFSGNYATTTGGAANGGAISNRAEGIISATVTITDSFFMSNQAVDRGGAIWSNGTLVIEKSTFWNNQTTKYDGGAIYIYNSAPSTIIVNSTFFGNIAGNLPRISNLGGAIYADSGSILKIENSTISGNDGNGGVGGLRSVGPLTLRNTILADSVDSSADCYWSSIFTTDLVADRNLIEANGPAGFTCGTPYLTADPNLSALTLNGGLTSTLALMAGSPAINAGNSDPAICPTTDQRGLVRPKGGACDIGAYEFDPNLQITSINPATKMVVSSPPSEPTFTLTVNGTGFLDGMLLLWNGTPMQTTYHSPTQLSVEIFNFLIDHPVEINIKVHQSNLVKFYAHTFADVLPTNTHWRNIEGLYAMGITGGCTTTSPLKYCPANTVTRQQMAIFLLRSMFGKDYTPPAATGIFTDVPLSSSYAPWIEELYHQGVTGGCSISPLMYCPTKSVTRGQMAVFLLRAKEGSTYTPPPATGVFTDVPVSSSTAPWIEELSERGITGGCNPEGTKYCPGNPVTRGQMGTFIVRMFEFDPLPVLP